MSALDDDDLALAGESAAIERLFAELHELVPLPAWQRIEDLMRRVVGLYGHGLARVLDHARAAGAGDAAFAAGVEGDELLGSLLLLHGLHPRSTEERVRGALAAIRAELDAADDDLILVAIEGEVVHLVIGGALGAGAMSNGHVERLVRKVIESAAPEVEAIHVAGVPPRRDPELVQIRTARPSP